jgi:hypothetical protein
LIVGFEFQSEVVRDKLNSKAYKKEKKLMRVSFKRSGGFMGITRSIVVDTQTLSQEEATQIIQLIEASDFFNLPHNLLGSPQPDRFQYKITVEGNGQEHEVIVDESTVPSILKPLLDWLIEAMLQK